MDHNKRNNCDISLTPSCSSLPLPFLPPRAMGHRFVGRPTQPAASTTTGGRGPGRCRAAPASTRAAPGRSADCGRPTPDLKQEGKEKGLRREWVKATDSLIRGAFSLAVDQVENAGLLLTVMGPRTSCRRSQTAKLAHCGAQKCKKAPGNRHG